MYKLRESVIFSIVHFAEFQKKNAFGQNPETIVLPDFKYKRTPVIREVCSNYRCSSIGASVLIGC